MAKKIRSIARSVENEAELDPEAYIDRLLYERPVVFRPILAELMKSVNAGLMLSQALYWLDRPKEFTDGFFWKASHEWQKETYLSRHEQEAARKLLRKKDFWKEELRKVPARMCFKVDLRLLKAELRRQFAEKRQTGSRETGKQERRESANLNAGNRQAGSPKLGKHLSLSESTSESEQIFRSPEPSQDAVAEPGGPVEENASRPPIVFPTVQSPAQSERQKHPLRQELFEGIYGKKIENAIIDGRRLSFAEMFRGAATEAALSLCSNRTRRMIGIDYKEIAAIVVGRLAPNFPTFQAIASFDSRVTSMVAAIANATIDAALQLLEKRPAGTAEKQKAFGW